MDSTLTQQALHLALDYDSTKGTFTNRVRRARAAPGSLVGTTSKTTGYVEITLHGRRYQAHRLAWLFTYGEWPLHDIDHLNGVRHDNRLCNLRSATRSENTLNRHAPSASSAGMLGVCFRKNRKSSPWWAQIQSGGRRVWSGYFSTAEAAHAAYCAKKLELFGFLPR